MSDNNGIDKLLSNLDATAVADEIANRINIAQANLATIQGSITTLHNSETGIAKLVKLAKEIHNIQEDLAVDVAEALDAGFSFNGSDGD